MRRGRGGFRGRHLVLGERGYYHVMSRMACGQYLMNDAAKLMFVGCCVSRPISADWIS